MYAILLAVSMTFAVLSSAYISLVAHPHFWKPITLPRLVWLSTALILAGSYCLYRAVRSLDRAQLAASRRWFSLALIAALAFLASQIGAWYELSRSGLIEAGNQQRSFFMILSATHGVHVLGGLVGLVYLRIRAQKGSSAARFPLPAAGRIISLFWHFMAGIWIFLLTLLLVWK
jgi:cytochrome c oxidase subunit 3